MNSYVSDLRNLVGHSPIMYCAATVAVLLGDQILLQKRHDTGEWGLHGGAVELGEHPEETAKRELLEETGLIADELAFAKIFAGKEHHYHYPNGDEVYIVDILYFCKSFTGTLKPQRDEVDRLQWFPLNHIPMERFGLDIPLFSWIEKAMLEHPPCSTPAEFIE